MANNNFKVFDENQTNIMSDEEYALHTQRADGVQSGVANSQLHNKIYRQATIMVKALADFIASQEYDATDADAALLAQNLRDALSKFARAPLNTHKTKTPLDHPDGSVTTPKLSNTGVAAGTYKSVTVDAKGRVTAATNPTTLGGYGITDAYPKSTSDARYLPIRGKAVDAEKADGLTLVDLGFFGDKTIGELKSALKAWVQNTGEKFASCRFSGNTGIDTLMNAWNTSDATVIQPGGRWTVTKISTFGNDSYGQFLFANYFSKRIYIANIEDNVWGSMFSIPINSDLITSINGVSTIAGGAVDLSSVFLRNDGSNSTSAIRVPAYTIARLNNKGSLDICGGTGYKEGAYLSVRGKDAPQFTGAFSLGTNNHIFYGRPNGSLTWDDKHIVRSVNGKQADITGNVIVPTASTSSDGLLQRLSGNANDVMCGDGTWLDTSWKQAFFGSFTTTGNVICTLPATWKECFFYVSTQGYGSHCEPLGPVTPGIKGIPICQTGDSGVELLLNINALNQVTMTNRGGASDGIVRGVFYR